MGKLEELKSAGIQVKTIAEALDVSRQQVYNIFKNDKFTTTHMTMLSTHLNINPNFLLKGEKPIVIKKNADAMDNEVQYLKTINKLLEDKVRMLEERLESYEAKKGANNQNQKAG